MFLVVKIQRSQTLVIETEDTTLSKKIKKSK